MRTNPGPANLAVKRYRSRLELIEKWEFQLRHWPQAEITRSEAAATLRVFLNHEPCTTTHCDEPQVDNGFCQKCLGGLS